MHKVPKSNNIKLSSTGSSSYFYFLTTRLPFAILMSIHISCCSSRFSLCEYKQATFIFLFAPFYTYNIPCTLFCSLLFFFFL